MHTPLPPHPFGGCVGCGLGLDGKTQCLSVAPNTHRSSVTTQPFRGVYLFFKYPHGGVGSFMSLPPPLFLLLGSGGGRRAHFNDGEDFKEKAS